MSDVVKPALMLLSREQAIRRGKLVLVVEDNEINQKVILRQLTLLGQAADIASNGREAFNLWQSEEYGLLLTDLQMPVMDGYELTAAIRAAENERNAADTGKSSHIPIIAFTANALKGEADQCIKAGMDDYLSKPMQLVNLKSKLQKWLPAETESTSIETTPDIMTASSTEIYVSVDVNVLKELIGDDETMTREFLKDFRASAEKISVALRAACNAGQSAVAGALAHKLKSSARSVGAQALADLCINMEQAGNSGDIEALQLLLYRFESELAKVLSFLDHY